MDGNFIGREKVWRSEVSRWWIGSIEERFEERFRILVWKKFGGRWTNRYWKCEGIFVEDLNGKIRWSWCKTWIRILCEIHARKRRRSRRLFEGRRVLARNQAQILASVRFSLRIARFTGNRSMIWWSQERESSKRNSVCIHSRSNGSDWSMKMFHGVCAISKTVSINAPSNHRSRFDRNHAGS